MQFRVLIVFAMFLCAEIRAEDWPQFRGPFGDGRSEASNLPTTWGRVLDPPVWETTLPGSGWSSPIVIEDRIWVTTAERTALEATATTEKLADHKYGGERFQADAYVKLLAIELNLDDGAVLRQIDLLDIEDPPPIHIVNSYASPTPVSDGKRVYCHIDAKRAERSEMAVDSLTILNRCG